MVSLRVVIRDPEKGQADTLETFNTVDLEGSRILFYY